MERDYVPEALIGVMDELAVAAKSAAEGQRLYDIYWTCYSKYHFIATNPPCDRWLQFLEETIRTPEVIAQIQEFFGYCLTPSTAFEKCLVCFGPGASGKSTLAKVLRDMVGIQHSASVGIEDLDNAFQRFELYGKLVNITNVVESKAWESAWLQVIVCGDTITASQKHHDSFAYVPTCKMVLVANSLPRFKEINNSFWWRLLPVQFKGDFSQTGDRNLLKTLQDELPGIFCWALDGYQRLRLRDDFTQCEETDRIMDTHQAAPFCSWPAGIFSKCLQSVKRRNR